MLGMTEGENASRLGQLREGFAKLSEKDSEYVVAILKALVFAQGASAKSEEMKTAVFQPDSQAVTQRI